MQKTETDYWYQPEHTDQSGNWVPTTDVKCGSIPEAIKFNHEHLKTNYSIYNPEYRVSMRFLTKITGKITVWES